MGSEQGPYDRLQIAQYEEIGLLKVRHDLFVVALDIGTSSSGYAISRYDAYKRDPLQISTFGWNSRTDGFQHFKTLSAVLLTPDGERHSIGYDAEYYYINTLQEAEREKWFYFQNFKMRLYDQKVRMWNVLMSIIYLQNIYFSGKMLAFSTRNGQWHISIKKTWLPIVYGGHCCYCKQFSFQNPFDLFQ